ncbi:MAG: CAAX protease [Mycobacterium sp.]
MAGHDRSRALALYEWSTSLNAALLHDFAHLEVGLRNMYDAALMGAVAVSDNHWLDSTSAGQLFPRTVVGNDRTHGDIAAARGNAGGAGAPTGKIIAELSFGFWVFLTARRHEPLVWLPHLAHAYPSGTRRAQLHRGLSDLVKARNRVAHHEPATAGSGREIVRRIHGHASYASPELAQHIEATSTVESIIRNRP